MVHEKYIKREGKVFGPYLYENYRENGITKTRYLGRPETKKVKRHNFLFLGIGLFLILILLIGSISLFLLERSYFVAEGGEGLASYSPLDFFRNLFVASSPFSVFVTIEDNTRPKILNLTLEIEVCENTIIKKSPPDYLFYIEDKNGASTLRSIILNPSWPVFFIDTSYTPGSNITDVVLWSNKLIKTYVEQKRYLNYGWGVWNEVIIVDDGGPLVTQTFNITIIEVNNPPMFNMSAVTLSLGDDIYTVGDDNIWTYDLGDYLRRQLEETSTGDLVFNLTYVNGSLSPFRINNEGIINITGNEGFIAPGNFSTNYYLNLSAKDNGLSMRTAVHPNISKCYSATPAGTEDPKSWSSAFWLTVTKQNRAPIITSYYPLPFNLSINGASILYFNLTARDPDLTPLDVSWYVDGVVKRSLSGLMPENVSEFEYLFPCDSSGEHKIKAIVSDGLVNVSLEYNITIKIVSPCAVVIPGSGGGGGGGGRTYCEEKWGCGEWMQCQNLLELSEAGWTSKQIELSIKERCNLFSWQGSFCGFQQRICEDFNYCNTEKFKPATARECYYTENPNCGDGIKNCHSSSCEVLVDCGGPCEACPTCYDQIKNQGEERIDCGGPCEKCVENPLAPRVIKYVIIYSLILLFLLILFLVGRQTFKYLKGKKTFQASKIKNPYIRKEESGNRNILNSLFFLGFVVLLLFLANAYIIRVAQTNLLFSEFSNVGGGFVASYGFINGLLKNIGVFFISVPFVNSNSKMQLFDDTENYFPFTLRDEYSGDLLRFYANYTDLNSPPNPITNAMCPDCCRVQFQDFNHNYNADWRNMNYNSTSLLWEYGQLINYKGKYNFSVECYYGGVLNYGEDNFTVRNTAPEIRVDKGKIFIDFDGDNSNTDYWFCIEDTPCYYHFSENVTDPDINDVLTYMVEPVNTTLTNYVLSPTGVLRIDVTNSVNTGTGVNAKKIQLGVKDNELDALTYWAKLWVNIQEVNDAPVFNNLNNRTLLIGELFSYNISISDEESNKPFVFTVSPNSLFDASDYTVDSENGILRLSFIPTSADLGVHEITFSVMDYNSALGNSTTTKTVNFSVTFPVWKEPLQTTFIYNEGDSVFINLSSNVSRDLGEVVFSKGESFPSFNISSEGIINFVPDDEDVGSWSVEVIATNPELSSSKFFNFIIFNQNDSLSFPSRPLQADRATVDLDSNVWAYENLEITLILFVEDNDLAIDSSQKSFYDEKINLSVDIQGPNSSLLNFVFYDVVQGNRSVHTAKFTSLNDSVGEYIITVNATDYNGWSKASFNFTLNILNNDYTVPEILYPSLDTEFNLVEGVQQDIIFRANHSAADEDLIYEVYINGSLRSRFLGSGNNTNVVWNFTPTFRDETYGNNTNLTLIVRNQNLMYPDLWSMRAWNLNISHSNAPVEFIVNEIFNETYTTGFAYTIDLKRYFSDVDYFDPHYNQKVDFDILSDAGIYIGSVSGDWKTIISSDTPLTANLNITASDYNLTNESMVLTSITSNNFQIKFETSPPVVVYVPTSGGGSSGSSSNNIVALKLITPGRISVNESERITVPIYLVNTGMVAFNKLFLNSSAFKQGEEIRELETSLDKTLFESLAPGKQENLSLDIFFNTSKAGEYEVLVTVESQYPKYRDWGKIYINLQAVNESQVRELLVFTEEFVVQNPQCIEITEIINEARDYLVSGDYANANVKTKQALEACKKAISQVSVPRERIKYFDIGIYLILAAVGAAFLGLIYYFIKRRRLQEMTTNISKIKEESIKRF